MAFEAMGRPFESDRAYQYVVPGPNAGRSRRHGPGGTVVA
jgi:hypothetical protein